LVELPDQVAALVKVQAEAVARLLERALMVEE
jgi:hypothetical protein